MGEWGFLDKILPQLKRTDKKRFIVPPGDDAAVMATPARAVLSIDGLSDHTHFKSTWEKTLKKRAGFSLGRGLGWKLIGSSLSDLAAMGDVTERWTLVFLAAPAQMSTQFLSEFYAGVREAVGRFDCALVGGDTIRSQTLTLSAAVGGTLRSKRALTRAGASAGDFICVAGEVGDAERGLQVQLGKIKNIPNSAEQYFIRRFFDSTPLFSQGKILAQDKDVTSLLDLSDSLQESINILLRPQMLGCDINLNAVPVSPDYRKLFGALPSLLSGGEDYGLLFTAKNKAVQRLSKKMKFSVIGQVLSSKAGRTYFLNGRGIEAPPPFRHFN